MKTNKESVLRLLDFLQEENKTSHDSDDHKAGYKHALDNIKFVITVVWDE